jgi:hypothetical protein
MQLKFDHWPPPISLQQLPQPQLQPSLLRHVRHGTLLHNPLSATSGGLFRSIVPILYLNIITWYYQYHYNAAQSNADELAQLRRLMHKACSAKSITALLWVLVTDPDSYRIHHLQAAWLLNRLLRVESRLSIRLQLRLETILLQFLLTDEIRANESSWPTPEQFQSEVMADLDFEPSEYTLSLEAFPSIASNTLDCRIARYSTLLITQVMIYDDPLRNAFALSYSIMIRCKIRNSSAV